MYNNIIQWTLSILNTHGTDKKCSDYGDVHYRGRWEMRYYYYVLSLENRIEYLAWLVMPMDNVKLNLVSPYTVPSHFPFFFFIIKVSQNLQLYIYIVDYLKT